MDLKKNAFQPASHIFPMESNELCVITTRIWTSLDFLGSCGNDIVHYLFDIVVTIFGSPTMIGWFSEMFCSWGLLGFMYCTLASVSATTVLGSKVISGVDPAELT